MPTTIRHWTRQTAETVSGGDAFCSATLESTGRWWTAKRMADRYKRIKESGCGSSENYRPPVSNQLRAEPAITSTRPAAERYAATIVGAAPVVA